MKIGFLSIVIIFTVYMIYILNKIIFAIYKLKRPQWKIDREINKKIMSTKFNPYIEFENINFQELEYYLNSFSSKKISKLIYEFLEYNKFLTEKEFDIIIKIRITIDLHLKVLKNGIILKENKYDEEDFFLGKKEKKQRHINDKLLNIHYL